MPSSPIGPCSSGSTTVRSPARRRRRPARPTGRRRAPAGSSVGGSASGPAANARLARLGQRPLAVGRDADRRDAVPRRVGRSEHVAAPSCSSRRARPTVRRTAPRGGCGRQSRAAVAGGDVSRLGGEPDPGRTHRGTVPFGAMRIRASQVAEATGGALAATRRRPSTARRSTPDRCGPASCSSRSSPSATATTSSRPRRGAGAAATLWARPGPPPDGLPVDRGGRHRAPR